MYSNTNRKETLMQVRRILGTLATAVLFGTTCATAVLACDSGGNNSPGCSVGSTSFMGISWDSGCSSSCNSGSYACCNNPNYYGFGMSHCSCVSNGY
jgi:hypothetical protein